MCLLAPMLALSLAGDKDATSGSGDADCFANASGSLVPPGDSALWSQPPLANAALLHVTGTSSLNAACCGAASPPERVAPSASRGSDSVKSSAMSALLSCCTESSLCRSAAAGSSPLPLQDAREPPLAPACAAPASRLSAPGTQSGSESVANKPAHSAGAAGW